MQYIRNRNNPNLIVGIFLLLVLAVFMGPNTLPRLVSTIFPGVDESIPCAWLHTGIDRANHQSLVGRAADNPIQVSVRTSAIPRTADGYLTIIITVVNSSLGTVPIIYNPNQVIVGDNGTSGLGIIFNPPSSQIPSNFRQDAASIPETDIRVLGPRQRCVHRMDIPAGNVLIDPALVSGNAQVRAFYRNNSAGQVTQPANTLATPIYNDQGLWTGYVTSDPATIPLAAQ